MRMMLMATGTVDSASIPAATTTDGAGISAGLSAIIKKNKRTLVNFQEQFLIPFVTKAAYRFMQFDPENYPAQDFKFVPSSNLGIIAREYEQMQFMNLLKTLGPDSPIVPMVMMSIIENSGLNNREQLIAQMQQMMQPNPEQQQLQQASQQIQLQGAQAIVAKTTAEAQREAAEAQKVLVETQLLPEEMRAKVIASVSRNLPDEDNAANREFDRRIKVAELMLKEKEMENDLKVVELQTGVKMGKVQDIMKKQDDQLKQAAMGVE
jgi:hypothetical protein